MARRPLRVGSTFSGVGGADLGLERAGFQLAWTCEWDEWKRSVLAAHWPDVPHYSDVRDVAIHSLRRGDVSTEHDGRDADATERKPDECHDPAGVDLLVGGFPCQDLSVAGKRRGFDGERSVLAFEFLRIAESLRPRWLLMENVPGLLSSNGGRDLARLLDEVGAIGYGWAYRILDARYFGVPQRRRRIFIVARRADAVVDSRAAAGLALRAVWEGSGGDSTKGWPPREITTASAGGCAQGGRIVGALSAQGYQKYTDQEFVRQGQLVTSDDEDAVAFGHTQGIDVQASAEATPTLRKNGGGAAVAFRKSKRAASDQDDESWVADDAANTLNAFDVGDTRTTHAIIQTPVTDVVSTLQGGGGSPRGQRNDAEGAAGGHLIPTVASTLQAQHGRGFACNAEMAAGGQLVPNEMSVRRLTPVECERLMGWPDNWTAPEGVKAPDSKRYAACGDGIVSWVAYWIGCRIQMIEDEA